MNRALPIFGFAVLLVQALPYSHALAASEALRSVCSAKAERVRPALRQDEKEAYIASCIADATPTPKRK